MQASSEALDWGAGGVGRTGAAAGGKGATEAEEAAGSAGAAGREACSVIGAGGGGAGAGSGSCRPQAAKVSVERAVANRTALIIPGLHDDGSRQD